MGSWRFEGFLFFGGNGRMMGPMVNEPLSSISITSNAAKTFKFSFPEIPLPKDPPKNLKALSRNLENCSKD